MVTNSINTLNSGFQNYSVNSNLNSSNSYASSIFDNPNINVTYADNVKFDEYAADDGKISFGDKVKNFGKGLISPITSMFSSPKNFLIGAASVIGIGALTVATGGAITPLLVAGGVVAGGTQLVSGAYKAATAKTDAEAEAAWQGMGAGTVTLAGSVAGAKGALKAAGVEGASEMGALRATANCFKQIPNSISNSVSEIGTLVSSFTSSKGAVTAVANSVDDAVKFADDAANFADDAANFADDAVNHASKTSKVDYSKPGTYTDSSGHKIVVDDNGTGIYVHDDTTFQVTSKGGAQKVYSTYDAPNTSTGELTIYNNKSGAKAASNSAPKPAETSLALESADDVAKLQNTATIKQATAQTSSTANVTYEQQLQNLNNLKEARYVTTGKATATDANIVLKEIANGSGNSQIIQLYKNYEASPSASTIKSLYRALSTNYHPDAAAVTDDTIFSIMNSAYKTALKKVA